MPTNKNKEILSQQDELKVAHDNFQKGLNTYAYFKVHDRSVSEGLVQDTFVKTWKYIVKGGKIEVMKAFLYHILNNLIVDEYRKKKTVSLDGLIEKGFEPSTGDSEKLFNALDGQSAVHLITLLPKHYQEVMRMRYIQDLSLTEMSRLTGKSKNTIAVQLHRGLEKLKVIWLDPKSGTR